MILVALSRDTEARVKGIGRAGRGGGGGGEGRRGGTKDRGIKRGERGAYEGEGKMED